MNTVPEILMVAAFILILLGALKIEPPKVNLGWAGMACWALAIVVGGFVH